MSERLFYVLDRRTYVGNCALFWAKNRAGYCCDPSEAHVFTETEIRRETWRATDVPVLKDDVDRACVRHFRIDTETAQKVMADSDRALDVATVDKHYDRRMYVGAIRPAEPVKTGAR
jgi:hypothetical protein